MTRLVFRSLRETMAENLARLPEAALWLPILNRADDDGLLPDLAAGEAVLQQLGLDLAAFYESRRRALSQHPDFVVHRWVVRDVAQLHEFWVDQQGLPT